MKILFSKPGKYVRLADKEHMVFCFSDGQYYDINGNPVPVEEKDENDDPYDYDDNPWSYKEIEYQGIEEKLLPESVIEPEYEIDDLYGQYGYKNRKGEFVIEPQYAYADNFTHGLAAVNLNRTWFRSVEGYRRYENHYGYINERGETVIPFAFDYAEPFNKYGVAVVSHFDGGHLIDLKGNKIETPDDLIFPIYHDYNQRYYEISYRKDNPDETPDHSIRIGIYDTKKRKVVVWPSFLYFEEYDEDHILVTSRKVVSSFGDDKTYSIFFIDSKGNMLYPWLIGKGFSSLKIPNRHLVSIVGVTKYIEDSDPPMGYFEVDGKKYDRIYLYGLYSSNAQFILQPEYDEIVEIADNLFACRKNGTVSIIEVEDSDCQ